MNDTINQKGAGAPALPAERAAFEALFKMPSHCIRVGDGYVATEYNAWGAHEYSHLRRGWLAALKWQASAAAPAAPVVQTQPDAALVEALRSAIDVGRRAIGDHSAPHDCYATGPMTGDPFRDLVECPACAALAEYEILEDALAGKGGE